MLMAACTSSGEAANTQPDPPATTELAGEPTEELAMADDPVCVAPPGGPNSADEFVGLTMEQATELASSRGLFIRLAGEDGECLPLTDDIRSERINIELRNGVVITADKG